MTVQQTVYPNMGFGVIGEIYNNGPVRSQAVTIDTTLIPQTNNVIGRAFTYTPADIAMGDTTVTAGNPYASVGPPADYALFAGILVGPKQHALYGDGTDPLGPSLVLPNGTVGDFVTMGEITVNLAAPCNLGDQVIYANATGILSTIAPGAAIPATYSSAFAIVSVLQITGTGPTLAVIRITATP